MILPTRCTVVYTANAFGSTPLVLAAALASVPVDASLLALTGVTVNSDSTTHDSSSATRTIQFNIAGPTFQALFPPSSDQTAPFFNLMTNALAAAAKSPVIAADPFLS